jgi:hypothetical protein
MQRKMMTIGIVACVLALVIGGISLAQPGAGGRQRGGDQGGQGQRGGGDRPQFDPAQIRQRMMEGWKQTLGADDESWKVIEPRLARVLELNRPQMMGARGMMPGGMRGPGGQQGPQRQFRGPDNQEPTEVEKATEALATTLENQSAPPEQIKQRLTALRAAREKQRTQLATAQKELRDILTLRQEAALIMRGMLD